MNKINTWFNKHIGIITSLVLLIISGIFLYFLIFKAIPFYNQQVDCMEMFRQSNPFNINLTDLNIKD